MILRVNSLNCRNVLSLARVLSAAFALAIFAASVSAQSPHPSLRIYAVDVEGGKATLYVSPSGESMLVDTGWGDREVLGLDPKYANSHRDVDRIVTAAQAAGVKQIDYLVITHYHPDHAGGVAQLAARMPIKAFYDHGDRTSKVLPAEGIDSFPAYAAVRQKYPHVAVGAGDTIPVKGIRVDVVAAAGKTITKPLPGAGQVNPLCATYEPEPIAPGENPQSIGLVITFGKLRIADLGDLSSTPNKQLTCPVNNIGTVDLYMTTHHGGTMENQPELVHALQPQVVIMNNFASHGGTPKAIEAMRTSPGFIDLWQLHSAPLAGAHNASDEFIANPAMPCDGNWIYVSATADGAFTVRNSRNDFEKKYPARGK